MSVPRTRQQNGRFTAAERSRRENTIPRRSHSQGIDGTPIPGDRSQGQSQTSETAPTPTALEAPRPILDQLLERIAVLEREAAVSNRINTTVEADHQRPTQVRDAGIKLESITTRLHPKSSLEQRHKWLDELRYIFESSPQRYATDKARIAAGFFCIHADTRGQWTNYRQDAFPDREPTWQEFKDWTLEFIRGGRMTEVDIFDSYQLATQRIGQDPRQFHHYLASIERHMDLSENHKALGYFSKLVVPPKKELKALYHNDLPHN